MMIPTTGAAFMGRSVEDWPQRVNTRVVVGEEEENHGWTRINTDEERRSKLPERKRRFLTTDYTDEEDGKK